MHVPSPIESTSTPRPAPGQRIGLRPACPADDEFLYRVYASTRREELAITGWTEAEKEAFLRMQSHAQRQSYLTQCPQAQYSIVLRDGEPAGRMIIDRSGPTLLLMDIALLPEYRNLGIGTQLIRDLLDEADRLGQPVRLHVEAFNPAQALYQRLGFVHTGAAGIYQELTRLPRRREGSHAA